MDGRNHTPRKSAVITLCVLLIGLLIGVGWIVAGDRSSATFDSLRWKGESDRTGTQNRNVRASMIDDLTANHMTIGEPQSALLDKLGEPDWVDDARGEVAYHLRFIPTISGISRREYLILRFDSSKQLSSFVVAER